LNPNTNYYDPERYDWYGGVCPCGLPPGECREHPRARVAQRPPESDWRTWAYIAGRGAGKTNSGAQWVHERVKQGVGKRILLIAPTAADIRDVMVEGPSGLLATADPMAMPRWESSKRRVTWPSGAQAVCISGEEPNRARGGNFDTIWADELVAWQKAEQTWKLAMLALRVGSNPQALITTTPKKVPLLTRPETGPVDLLGSILESPGTILTSESTFANKRHLAKEFIEQIVSLYENTRLGKQEIYAQLLDLVEGVWFPNFDTNKHVNDVIAEYDYRYPVCLAIDCGISRETGAVFYQSRHLDNVRKRITVFGDFYSADSFSSKTAMDIRDYAYELPCQGRIDKVRLDPYGAGTRTGVGPSAYGEYEDVFGSRITSKWPGHHVVDGLDQIEIMLDRECLLIHSRAKHMIDAFTNYRREQDKNGIVYNKPEDPQHPYEELMDSLRGAVRDEFPEGHRPGPQYSRRHAAHV
jgi:Terminase large subunit, T4likevirus-type, N-terminal